MIPTALLNNNTTPGVLYMALELSQNKWCIAFGNGVKTRQVTIESGDTFNKLTISDNGRWTNVATNSSGDFFSIPVQAFANSYNSSNNVGARVGLGLEYCLSGHLRGTLDYTYTDFGKITTRAAGSNSDTDILGFIEVAGVDAPSVSVSAQRVMLGLRYDF